MENNEELAKSLFSEGLEQKTKGNLEGAKDCFSRGISHNPLAASLYYELGKLEFLRGEYGNSLTAYLAFTHLQLRKREAQLNGDLEFPKTEKSLIENFYQELPEEARDSLPRKSAAYILEDGDICNHAAHSYFGSQDISEPELLNNFKLYYATLVGPHFVQITLDQLNLSLKAFDEMNLNLFIPQGRLILLDNIAWDKLDSDDVLEIYFK